MFTYYCNDDEDLVIAVYSVDRDAEAIARILSKNLETDLVECESDEFSDFCDSSFTHDTVMLRWKEFAAYSENLECLESKSINLYIVF